MTHCSVQPRDLIFITENMDKNIGKKIQPKTS